MTTLPRQGCDGWWRFFQALTEVAAEKAVEAAARFQQGRLRYAVGSPLSEDPGLATALSDEVQRTIRDEGLDAPAVVLVDHGSPSPLVTAERDRMADSLRASLPGGLVASVTAASMERRPGDEYAFCEPLLENCLPYVGDGVGDVVLCLMFLLPGTHAGPQGDIDQICEAALRDAGVERRVVKTRLVGELDGLVQVLGRRHDDALARLRAAS